MSYEWYACRICHARFYHLRSESLSTCLTCMSRQLNELEKKLLEVEKKLLERPERQTFLCIDFEGDLGDIPDGDVKIIVQGKTEEPLFAHKLVLSSRSPVFRKMFNTKMLEEEKGVLPVDHATRDVISAMIKFCYDAEVNFADEVTAEGVLEMAHKYDIVLLQKMCEEQLIATITRDNLAKRWKIAMKYGAKGLEAVATEFLKTNYDAVISNFVAEIF